MTLEEELERVRESEGITKKASEDKRLDGFFNLVGNAVVPKNKNSNEITDTAAKGASYTPNKDYSDAGTSYEPAKILQDVAQQTVNDIPKSEVQSLQEDATKIETNGFDPDETYNHPEFKRVVERNKFDFNIVSGVQESSVLGVTSDERDETKQFANEVLFDRYNPEYAKSNPYISRYLTESKFKGTFVEVLYNKANDFVDSQVADYRVGQENSARYFKENKETTEYLKNEQEKIENKEYDLLADEEVADSFYFKQDIGRATLNGGIAVLHDTADTLDYYTAGKENNINILDDDDNGTRNSGILPYMVQNLLVKPMKSIDRLEYKSKNADDSYVLKFVEETSSAIFDRYVPLSPVRTILKIPVEVDKEYQRLTASGMDEQKAFANSVLNATNEVRLDERVDNFAGKYKKGRYEKLINTATDVVKGIDKADKRMPIDYSKINRTIDVALMNSFAKKSVEQFVHETKMNLLNNEIASGDSTDTQSINSVIYIEPEALLNVKVNATDKKALGIDMQEVMRANFAGEMVEVPKSKYVSLVVKDSQLHSQMKDYIAFDDSYVTNKRLRFQEMLREYYGDILLSTEKYQQTDDFKVNKENLYIYHSIKNSRNFRVPKRKKISDYGA